MAKTRMAPRLQRLVWEDGDRDGPAVIAELRALLRVARAARELADVVNTSAAFCEACGYENPLAGTDGSEALNNALAALDRVSGRQRKGGRP